MPSIIDQWTEIINGVKFRVTLEPDYGSTPPGDDDDWASPKDRELWRRDQWYYVGVIVSVDIDCIDPAWADASLWGCQYGDGDGWTVGRTELLEYPVRDLADEAMANLGKISQRLADAMAARDEAIVRWELSKHAEAAES